MWGLLGQVSNMCIGRRVQNNERDSLLIGGLVIISFRRTSIARDMVSWTLLSQSNAGWPDETLLAC